MPETRAGKPYFDLKKQLNNDSFFNLLNICDTLFGVAYMLIHSN